MSFADAPRCTHITVTGHRCGSPALRKQHFCYFHTRMIKGVNYRVDMCISPDALFESPDTIQTALMQVYSDILQGQIEYRKASLLLKALQIATSLSRRVDFERARYKMVTEVPNWAQQYFDEHPELGPPPTEAEIAAVHKTMETPPKTPAAPAEANQKPGVSRQETAVSSQLSAVGNQKGNQKEGVVAQESEVSGQKTGVSSQLSAVSNQKGNQKEAVGAQESGAGNRKPPVSSPAAVGSNPNSAVSSPRSTASNHTAAIEPPQSATGNRQPKISEPTSANPTPTVPAVAPAPQSEVSNQKSTIPPGQSAIGDQKSAISLSARQEAQWKDIERMERALAGALKGEVKDVKTVFAFAGLGPKKSH